MMVVLVAAVLLALILVLWGAAPTGRRNPHGVDAGQLAEQKANLKSHGKGLADHGKQLKETAAGGKKCPHCGKPI